jgi:hypothetical protein
MRHVFTSAVARNVRWGLRWGLYVAIVCTALAAIGFLASPPGEHEATFSRFVGIYFVGGIAAGAIVGCFRDRLHSAPWSMVAGVLAATPVMLALYVVAWDTWPWEWRSGHWAWIVLSSVFSGVLVSVLVRTMARRSRR